MHYAAQENQVEIAQLLIQHGANVNELDDEGQTPLFIAAEEGNDSFAELLLQHGADVDCTNDVTPYYISCVLEQYKMADLLLQFGADINKKDKDGRTPLFYATLYKKERLVHNLMEHNADVSIVDNQGISIKDMDKKSVRRKLTKNYGFVIEARESESHDIIVRRVIRKEKAVYVLDSVEKKEDKKSWLSFWLISQLVCMYLFDICDLRNWFHNVNQNIWVHVIFISIFTLFIYRKLKIWRQKYFMKNKIVNYILKRNYEEAEVYFYKLEEYDQYKLIMNMEHNLLVYGFLVYLLQQEECAQLHYLTSQVLIKFFPDYIEEGVYDAAYYHAMRANNLCEEETYRQNLYEIKKMRDIANKKIAIREGEDRLVLLHLLREYKFEEAEEYILSQTDARKVHECDIDRLQFVYYVFIVDLIEKYKSEVYYDMLSHLLTAVMWFIDGAYELSFRHERKRYTLYPTYKNKAALLYSLTTPCEITPEDGDFYEWAKDIYTDKEHNYYRNVAKEVLKQYFPEYFEK